MGQDSWPEKSLKRTLWSLDEGFAKGVARAGQPIPFPRPESRMVSRPQKRHRCETRRKLSNIPAVRGPCGVPRGSANRSQISPEELNRGNPKKAMAEQTAWSVTRWSGLDWHGSEFWTASVWIAWPGPLILFKPSVQQTR